MHGRNDGRGGMGARLAAWGLLVLVLTPLLLAWFKAMRVVWLWALH